jgi:hypothetical protein
MTDDTGGRPVRTGRAALAAAAAGMALLAAACGGGSSPAAAGSKTYQQALAYTHCMRAHGELTFPDPTSQGTISAGQLDISSAQYLSAANACHLLQPPGGVQLSAAQQQAATSKDLRLAACVRSHGIPNFPDPVVKDGQTGFVTAGTGIGVPDPDQLQAAGIDVNSPLFQSAVRTCAALVSKSGGGS